MARLVGRVQDLVVEDGEVQGKTEADRVCWGKVSLSDFGGILVCLKRLVCGALSLFGDSEFSKVSVIVTLPVQMSDGVID